MTTTQQNLTPMEWLQRFCANLDDYREMGEPFTLNNNTYATDGAICVQVPLLQEVTAAPPPFINETFLRKVMAEPTTHGSWVPFPVFPEAQPTKECSECGGAGTYSYCPECEGDGEVRFDNDFHTYGCVCITCSGDGVVRGTTTKCERCGGKGKVLSNPYKEIDVHGRPMALGVVARCLALPFVEVFVPAPWEKPTFPESVDDSLVFQLRFAGGRAVAMGLESEGG